MPMSGFQFDIFYIFSVQAMKCLPLEHVESLSELRGLKISHQLALQPLEAGSFSFLVYRSTFLCC